MWYLWVFQSLPHSLQFILFRSFSTVPPAKILNSAWHQKKWTICWESTLEVLPCSAQLSGSCALTPGQWQPFARHLHTGCRTPGFSKSHSSPSPQSYLLCWSTKTPLWSWSSHSTKNIKQVFSRLAQNSFAVKLLWKEEWASDTLLITSNIWLRHSLEVINRGIKCLS